MIRFATVTDREPETSRVKVSFLEDDLVTDWLPVLVPGSLQNKFFALPDTGEQVAVAMQDSDFGVVLGSFYSEVDTVPEDFHGGERVGVELADGDIQDYTDRELKTKRVKIGDTELVLTEAGWTVKRSDESLKAILTDLIDAILSETHPTPSGPSGTPINAAAYQAIKERIPNLFEG